MEGFFYAFIFDHLKYYSYICYMNEKNDKYRMFILGVVVSSIVWAVIWSYTLS